jgi:hypothetical protein
MERDVQNDKGIAWRSVSNANDVPLSPLPPQYSKPTRINDLKRSVEMEKI